MLLRLLTVLLLSTILTQTGTSATRLNLPTQKVLPLGSFTPDLWFGNQVDISGNYLAVSGPTSGNRGGKAYLYRFTGTDWDYVTDLSAQSIHESEYFYFAGRVAVSDGGEESPVRVLVSSNGGGRVFEELNGSWVETSVLSGFGAIDKNTAISVVDGPEAVVSRFDNSSWANHETLEPSFPDAFGLGGSFGEKVILDGDTLLISAATQDSGRTINSGAVFAYQQTNGEYTYVADVIPSDPIWRGNFGRDIDFAGATLIAGRPAGGPAASGPFQGLAYVFDYSNGNWVETARLEASDGYLDDGFGSRVAISKNFAAATSLAESGEGRVYIFRRNGYDWTELGWLETGNAFDTDQFGISLEMDGNQLVVGARLDDDKAEDTGAVYVFTIPEPSVPSMLALLLVSCLPRRQRFHLP